MKLIDFLNVTDVDTNITLIRNGRWYADLGFDKYWWKVLSGAHISSYYIEIRRISHDRNGIIVEVE